MDNTELTELIEKLGLKNHSYTFSVVTLDSENYVTGAYIESADELEELEILSQFDDDFSHDDTVRAEISYYVIGQTLILNGSRTNSAATSWRTSVRRLNMQTSLKNGLSWLISTIMKWRFER